MAIPEKPPLVDFPHPTLWDKWIGKDWNWKNSRQPIDGADYITWKELPSGLQPVFNLDKLLNDLGSFGAATPNDFTLSDATTNVNGTITLQVKVLNGTVYDTVGGSTFLPTGMTQGGQPPFLIGVAGSGDIYLAIAVSTSGTVTGVTINQGATPVSTSTATYLKLGDFAVNSAGNGVNIGAGAQGIGSQSFLSCAGIGYPWSL